ncbi:MAG: hypothetical protein EBT57_07135 [Verrucomicrobia bacterium]|nr:hypothetical protein [Verrucomicrobiota bacterium]
MWGGLEPAELRSFSDTYCNQTIILEIWDFMYQKTGFFKDPQHPKTDSAMTFRSCKISIF